MEVTLAERKSKRRQPRIRKTAPSVRELTEAKQNQSETKVSKASRPKKLAKALFRPLGPILRPINKFLLWLTPRYFVNSWREVRQVTWPSRRETWRLTLAVFIFATVFGTVVYFVDKGLDEIFKKVVLK